MDKETYEFIRDKYADAEFSLFELVEALRGYDDIDADSVEFLHERIKVLLTSFHKHHGEAIHQD